MRWRRAIGSAREPPRPSPSPDGARKGENFARRSGAYRAGACARARRWRAALRLREGPARADGAGPRPHVRDVRDLSPGAGTPWLEESSMNEQLTLHPLGIAIA